MIKDNEEVYDKFISPLMTQIIAICKEHRIPMFATFVYKKDGLCTTSLPVQKFYPEDEESDENKMCLELYQIAKRPAQTFAFTIIETKK